MLTDNRLVLACAVSFFVVILLAADAVVADSPRHTLVVPATDTTLHLAVPLPNDVKIEKTKGWQLVEVDRPPVEIPAELIAGIGADGSLAAGRSRLVADIPPRRGAKSPRRFRLETAETAAAETFRFEQINDKSIRLSEGDSPVFVYNHGTITDESVPKDESRRSRACYVHPVWGLGGEVLTDDFSKDHFHHHGIFWAWPHVKIDGKAYDLWMYRNIRPRFVRWIYRQSGSISGVLAVENGWFVGDKKVMVERVWLRSFKADNESRAVDIEFAWIPTDKPVTLQGAGGKSYGGLNMRLSVWPRRDAIITTPHGATEHEGSGMASPTDISNKPLPWADISTRIPGCPVRSGAAVFVPPSHPDYPPTWLTRHYGPLCVGWPGVKARTFQPGEVIRLSYRIWIHRNAVDVDRLKQAYEGYTAAEKATWE